MFKFYTKGDDRDFEAAVFYNGQKIATVYTSIRGDQVEVQVEDGSNRLMAEWSDFAESH
jgi:hypothetical protein